MAAALLDAATEWARGKGRSRILGPMDFTTNDEIGILIEGYERRPMILEPWHPPYYRELIEAEGFGKAMDVLMWELQFGDLKEGERFDPSIHAAAEKALHDEGIVIRNMRKRDMADEVRRFMDVYNEAWGDNWGFVPITDAEVEFQAKNLKQVIDEDWAYMAEKDGEVVGAALTLPDINQVMAKLNGRLLPFGWPGSCSASARSTSCGSSRSASSTTTATRGVAAGLYLKHLETAAVPGGDRRRRDGLDPRDQRADEPGDGGHGRQGRQEVPGLREASLGRAARSGVSPRCSLRKVRPSDALAASRARSTCSSQVEGEVSGGGGRLEADAGRSRCGRCRALRGAPPRRPCAARSATARSPRARRRSSPAPRPWPRCGRSARSARASAPRGRLSRRRERPANVVASRSFLVDVHLLGR